MRIKMGIGTLLTALMMGWTLCLNYVLTGIWASLMIRKTATDNHYQIKFDIDIAQQTMVQAQCGQKGCH
ncbi:hypothetical protein B4V02_05420 [Paenibacillus kribbensis]|uniref:Uncharacterized protein n=1 Tax=Paenibacillus kribbensis TaxID=172713 RepID=A0A222WIB8_9BACL|nr:hypothetical protein B4V02_05420 [Paenibacillus kribbensis]